MEELQGLDDVVGEVAEELPLDAPQLPGFFIGERAGEVVPDHPPAVARQVIQHHEKQVGDPVERPHRQPRHRGCQPSQQLVSPAGGLLLFVVGVAHMSIGVCQPEVFHEVAFLLFEDVSAVA